MLRRGFIGMVVKTAFLTGIVSSMSKGQAHNLQLDYPDKVRRRRLFSFAKFARPAAQKHSENFGLFGSVEISGGDNRAFRKWQSVLPECEQQLKQLKQCMAGDVRGVGPVQAWSRILRRAGQSKSLRQLSLLNSFINESVGSGPQSGSAGPSNAWRAPLHLLGSNGECEDYAIAKYFSLLALGYPEEALRFVVVKDSRSQTIHAVTSVRFQGEQYVLDSLRSTPAREIELLHYQPVVSMQRGAHFSHFRTAEMRQRFWARHSHG
ncbi:hypothetical protein GCM10007094_26060 [Pseudovibrio japonicus]|uniref:Periplasmic protein n=1 Tax=Pseudovibrio japonicus TaxID=366534 RepID=A0ABQ3EM76_9HYPH|nr:transglutaminase-like cysteine peptidase [Pseudovibrio japonicus]GHB35325.1 hypothetical protein GCM10007094_26060 [Pseudovibrio japonicus]